ncbi:hypothetical protein [Streptomyces virginiae]|uniref:hypothetical protein n=1 Tax=Streptomyces virginiae TaxID=1961 RepID=UPI00225296C4|nr:hypothetical protein [Streptomyces virginiae]MCX5174349.1 hypothetical protein [Streptomyces virginiae]
MARISHAPPVRVALAGELVAELVVLLSGALAAEVVVFPADQAGQLGGGPESILAHGRGGEAGGEHRGDGVGQVGGDRGQPVSATELLVRAPEHLGELTDDRDFLRADAAAARGRFERGGHGLVVVGQGKADRRGGERCVDEFSAAVHH